jgi:hypothetical protein
MSDLAVDSIGKFVALGGTFQTHLDEKAARIAGRTCGLFLPKG